MARITRSDTKPRLKHKYVPVIIMIIAIFISSIILYDSTISDIETAKEGSIEQAQAAEFDKIWDHLQNLLLLAEMNAANTSADIEMDIKSTFDMDKLKIALDNNDPKYNEQLHSIFVENTEGKYLNDLHNNRNAFMILSGNGRIQEDYTVDVSVVENDEFYKNKEFSKYGEVAYNQQLFDTAFAQIKTHSHQIIAMELYNLNVFLFVQMQCQIIADYMTLHLHK